MISAQLVFWFALVAIVSTVVSIVMIVTAPPGRRPPWFVYFLFHIGAYTIWLVVHSFLFFNLVLMHSGSLAIARGGEMVHLLISLVILFTYPPFVYKIAGSREGPGTRLANLAVSGLLFMVLVVAFLFRSSALILGVNLFFNSYLLGFSLYGYLKLRGTEIAGLRATMRGFLGVATLLYSLLILAVPLAFLIPEGVFPVVGLLFTALFCFIWSVLMIRALLRKGMRPGTTRLVSDGFIRDFGISPREQDVLGKLVQGKTQRIIGDELFISTRTVEAHLCKIYRKAGVRNRMELLRILQNT